MWHDDEVRIGASLVRVAQAVAGAVSLMLMGTSCERVAAQPGSTAPVADTELPMAPTMPEQSGARSFRPEEGGFEVTLPPAADVPARSVEGDNHLAYEFGTPEAAYKVEVIYAPGGIANPEQFSSRMRESVAGAGRVASDRDTSLEGNPGWSMRLVDESAGPTSHLRVDLVLTPRRAYLLMVSAPRSDVLEANEVLRFFSSFRPKQTTGLHRDIRSREGQFELSFPAACGPAFKRVEMVEQKVYISYVSEGAEAGQCMVSVARVDPLPTDQVLGAAVDGAVTSIRGATVDGTEDSMIRGAPRRTLRLHATVDGVTLHMRADFIYADRILYQVQYLTSDPAEFDEPEIVAYFDSFRGPGEL